MFDSDNFCMGLMGSNKRNSNGSATEPGFDRWLARQMHKLYDEVLAEDVPDELLRVVERATRKDPSTKPESDGEDGPATESDRKPQ